jgi:hypothetical protein
MGALPKDRYDPLSPKWIVDRWVKYAWWEYDERG